MRSYRGLALGLVLVFVAAAAIGLRPRPDASPGVAWQPYTAAALETARAQGQPVVIDIFADWCLPCLELDHVTFRHAEVIAAMEPMRTLRMDVTDGIPEDGEALIERYRVYGVPTVLLFDAEGKERPTLRVLGFIPPREMLERLRQLE